MLFCNHYYKERCTPRRIYTYWYPATYIYGFVEGCWKTVEENQTLAKSMWPDDIRAVCGCAIDAIRHAMPFHEAESPDAETKAKFDFITQGVCFHNVLWK